MDCRSHFPLMVVEQVARESVVGHMDSDEMLDAVVAAVA